MLDETTGYTTYDDPYQSSGPGPGVPNNTPNVPQAPSGGYTNPYASAPDWGSIMANSPYVQAAHAMAQQQLAALQAQLGSSASRALINLGDAGLANQVGDLELPGNTGQLVKQANEAGTSILSQLGYHHGQNVESIPATLAGRGFYRSGQTGYALGQEDRGYGQQQYDARSKTLDYLNAQYANYLNAQFGIQQGELSAQMQAYQSALSMIPSMTMPSGGGTTAPSGPDTGAPVVDAYGGTYIGDAPFSDYYDGNYYT